jgi:putative ABC transport system permease protein
MNVAYVSQLSFRAMRHRPLPMLVSAMGLAAVLAPLLILYGLKSGIVTGLVETLKSDPTILRVRLTGSVSLTEGDIASLRARPEVGFAVGSPGTLAARMEMSSAARGLEVETSNWLPSGDNDPLLPDGMVLAPNEIAMAEPLAEMLAIESGDEVEAFAYRNNETEILSLKLSVAYVLPRQKLESGEGTLALVHESVMDMRDAFQGNFEVPGHSVGGRPLSERTRAFSSVRLYASSFEQVVALDRIMTGLGFRAESEAANIAWVESLDIAMTGVFGIISAAGLVGFSLSLWANVTSNLQQYRGQISLLRLLGLDNRALTAFPVVQVVITATLGLLAAMAISLAVAAVINSMYFTEMFDGSICRVGWSDVGFAAVVSYGVAGLVVLWQIKILRSIAPSEALAEDV